MDQTNRYSAFDLVAAQPWAIQPEMLETIASISRRENESVGAVEARLGRPLQNARSVTLRDGVAVVPVSGPIMRYANLFSEVSGATSLDMLARDFTAAAEDPAVKHIVLNIDSPGGQANGIAELAAMIRASSKPVTAYVDGTAASAAYWLASAAGRIVMSKTAMVGSIGAVLSLDTRKREGALEIVSSQSPNKRPDVTTDTGRAQIQSLIDSLAQVFVDDVAAYRGVSTDTVLEKFGQGAMFVGADAVARGMADQIGTLETLIAGLSGSTSKGGQIMAEANGTPAAEKPVIDRAYLAANHADLVVAIQSEAAAAERSRILDVQSQAAGFPGHDDLIASLVADGKTGGAEAALQILSAERGKGAARVDALRADAPAPVGHAEPTDGEPAPASDAPIEERAQAAWDKDAAIRAEFGQFATYLAFARANDAGQVKVLGTK